MKNSCNKFTKFNFGIVQLHYYYSSMKYSRNKRINTCYESLSDEKKKKEREKSHVLSSYGYVSCIIRHEKVAKFGRRERERERKKKKSVTHLYPRMLHRHIYTCRGFCEIIYNADGVESVTVISVHRKPGNFPVRGEGGGIEKLVNG